MILLIAVVVGFIIGLLSRGSLAGFSQARFRHIYLFLIGGLIQLVIFTEYLGATSTVRGLAPYLYVTALGVGLVAIYLNRHILGMKLVLIGAFLNFVVIALNGGSMPARAESLEIAGSLQEIEDQHQRLDAGEAVQWPQLTIADDDTRVGFLGDVFPIPESLPFSNVVSIGDIFIMLGAIIAVVWVMHLKPTARETESTFVEA